VGYETNKEPPYPIVVADALPSGANLGDYFTYTAGNGKKSSWVYEENKAVLRTYNVTVNGSSDVLSCDKDGKLTTAQLAVPASPSGSQKRMGWFDTNTNI